MRIIRLQYNDKYWDNTIVFPENCSWVAGKHLAEMMKNNRFTDWESIFIGKRQTKGAYYLIQL